VKEQSATNAGIPHPDGNKAAAIALQRCMGVVSSYWHICIIFILVNETKYRITVFYPDNIILKQKQRSCSGHLPGQFVRKCTAFQRVYAS